MFEARCREVIASCGIGSSFRGLSPLVCRNGAAGLDTRSPANIEKGEITRKKTSDRTEVDDVRLRELECLTTLYLDEGGAPTFACDSVSGQHRNRRPQVETRPQSSGRAGGGSSGTLPTTTTALGTTPEELARSCQFTTGVRVGGSRVLRTRARFDQWAATILVETDPELVDRDQLLRWLDIGGRRVGVGDWRPRKIGTVRPVRGGGHRTAPIETFFLAWLGVAWLGGGMAGLGVAWQGMDTPDRGGEKVANAASPPLRDTDTQDPRPIVSSRSGWPAAKTHLFFCISRESPRRSGAGPCLCSLRRLPKMTARVSSRVVPRQGSTTGRKIVDLDLARSLPLRPLLNDASAPPGCPPPPYYHPTTSLFHNPNTQASSTSTVLVAITAAASVPRFAVKAG